jgi:hypothetical protein
MNQHKFSGFQEIVDEFEEVALGSNGQQKSYENGQNLL